LVILLGGGTKQRQHGDIEAALRRWRDYKKQKRSNYRRFATAIRADQTGQWR